MPQRHWSLLAQGQEQGLGQVEEAAEQGGKPAGALGQSGLGDGGSGDRHLSNTACGVPAPSAAAASLLVHGCAV